MAAKLKYIFGFHCTIKQGIAFYNNKIALFLAGEMCVLHDIEQNEQKFLPFPELSIPTAMAQGQRNIIAVADKSPSRRVILYDIERASRKLFPEPSITASEYFCLCFSHDFQYLAAQAGPPEWAMVVWKCEKRTLRTVYFPTGMRSGAEICQIHFHPSDNDQIMAVGKEYLRLYKFEDDEGFKPHVFAKHEPYGDYLCTEWLSQGWLAVGTADGRILFFDGVEQTYHVTVTKQEIPESTQDRQGSGNVDRKLEERNIMTLHVTCIVSTPRGLICTYDESAAIEYTRTEDNRHYKFKRAMRIPKASTTVLEDIGEMETSKHKITFMRLSPNAELLLVCTDIGQLFSFSLVGEDITKGAKQYFTAVTQPVHRHAIIGMDVAVKMSLIVTCSERTIILWDYIKKSRIMRKSFHHAILCVAIHPLGLYLVIGFADRTRVFTVLSDGLGQTAEIETKSCTEAMFAHGGHMLAIVNGSNIEIYDFVTLELIAKLNGHQGTVTGMDWNRRDTMIFSCDTEGVIFGWDTITKEKILEIRVEGTAISAISANSEGNYIYAVGTDSTIKEICKSEICQTVHTSVELTSLSLSYTGLLLFGGTKKGYLKAFALPLCASAAQVDVPAHLGKINKLKIAVGDQYVMTAGADGMFCIWQIIDKGKPAKLVEFSEAVLIDQDDLKQCVDTVEMLKEELTEIQEEARYKLERKHAFHEERVHTASSNLKQKIEELNATIDRLSHENKVVRMQTRDKEIRLCELGKIERYRLEGSTLEKILKEHARSQKLRFASRSVEDSLYEKFYEVRSKCENDLKQLELSYEEKLVEEEKTIVQVNEEVKRKEEEHEVLSKELQFKREAQLAKVKANFARDIHLQKEEIEKLKEAHEIALKKIHRQQKTIDELKNQIHSHVNEETRLKEAISEIEKGILETQKTINQKSCNIQQLQGRILRLHGMKENLEKHKYVLNSALKSQMVDVEQTDGITEGEAKKIEELNSELDYAHVIQKKLEVEMELIGNKMRSIQKELENQKNKVAAEEHVLEKYKSDLLLCAAVIDDPQKLKNSLKTLSESHQHKRPKHEETDTKDEFQFPREHLEKTVHLLRKQTLKEHKWYHYRSARMGQEKDQNLRSINKLREDLEVARQRCQDMETALGMSSQEIIYDSLGARQKMEDAYAVVSKKEEKMKEEQKKQDDLILAQQKEISQLHALLYGSRVVK